MDNLSSSLDYVKGQTKYSKYTSSINEDTAQTFEDQFKNNPLDTVVKSGGVLMTMGKGLHDKYKNKQAMNILGYTGDVYNPRTGDYGEGGNRMLTGGATPSEREAMTQLAPAAPYIASGTGQPASVAAAWYANLGQGTQGFNFHSAYANAKAKVAQTLGNPGSVGQLAVNQSPFYNWLKDNSLDKGIL
jgi:predicted amidohydrolase YtcJ